MAKRNSALDKTKSIAIVSGKGGSGKTMVAAALAQALAIEGKRVLLVDADLGTGGLTYYLGFSAFDRARAGLTEYLLATSPNVPLHIARARATEVRKSPYLERMALLPVGEHRLRDDINDQLTAATMKRLIVKTRGEFDVVIFDCRGGLDEDSIETCDAVDEVVLVVETDAASIQATQYLANKLYEFNLGKKIVGFLLNKVMDDPSSLANAGISFFRTEYLGAVPFDVQTTRGFIRGEMPDPHSLFFRNVAAALGPVLGVENASDKYRPLSSNEFSSITLKNPDVAFGGVLLGLLGVYGALAFFLIQYVAKVDISTLAYTIIVGVYALLVLSSLSDSLKESLGQGLKAYRDLLQKVLIRK